MVRSGDWELTLCYTDGRRCPEVAAPSDGGRFTTYAAAAAGEEFTVKLTRHPTLVPLPIGLFHNAALYVDGQSVGYTKRLMQPSVATFEGFLQAGDPQACSYRSFVFATPKESEDKAGAGLNAVEGTVRAVVWLATTDGTENTARYQGPAEANSSVARMPEGKKFFNAPSLACEMGAVRTGPGFCTQGIQRLGAPIADLTLRYETPTTLMLRGVLRRGDPAHRAILDMFPETAVKDEQEDDEEERASGSGRGFAAGSTSGRKRQQAAAAAAGGRPKKRQEAVDLTRGPAPNDEVLAANRQNKVLECDLTGDDDEAPSWRAVDKR